MKLLFCLLLISQVGLAQTFTFNQGGPTSKNYYAEIPYESINGKIFINAEIAGKKHRFLFDTGAPVSISKELAIELNARVLHKDLMADANLNRDSVTAVEVNDLNLGGIIFNQIPATTLIPDFYKCMSIEGVIGSNLLRNSIVSIVSNRHIIIFTDQKNKLNLKSKNSAPLVTNMGLQSDPKIKILIAGKVYLGISFDTGDNQFLRASDEMVNMIKKYNVFDTLTTGYGASTIGAMGLQKNTDKYLLKIPFFTVGNGKFNNLMFESNKVAIPAIGSKLLDYGTVTLDFINSKFYFDANEAVNEVGEKQWPIRPTFINDKLSVGLIWQKAAGQVSVGDQIIAIDEVDYTQFKLCDLINTKPILEGKETAVLTIKDAKGAIKKVIIKKE